MHGQVSERLQVCKFLFSFHLQNKLTAKPSALVAATTTYSRSILPGQWFVALGGDNFDGYAFLEDAAR